jgi:hypothetical protein
MMNQSMEQDIFKISCHIFGRTHVFIRKLPSDKLLVNHIAILTVNIILIIPTILLNAVSITTIVKSSQLKNKLCYFIILLQSVTDLAVGVLGIPLFLIFLVTGMGKISNCFVATLAYRSSVLPIGVSILTLSALTMERYIAVLHPYSTQVTRRRILLYLCSGVVVMFLVAILSLAIEGLIKRFTMVLATLFFTFAAFVYARIYLVVRKLARPSDATAVNNLARQKMFIREIKQAQKCFNVVICFFVLCFLPVIVTISVATHVDKYELQAIQNWATTLSISNSSVNSIIFFWTKTMLRKEAAKMLKVICLH